MKRLIVFLIVALFGIFSTQSFAKDQILIGFTTSLTGKLNAESKAQLQGIQLWVNNVNKNGGIYVKSMGKKLPVALKYYDDESNKERVQQLYVRLINNDHVDFLISPYSSDLTATAAIIAQQYGKIMISTGAAADDIFAKGFSVVYQMYTPASRYLTGALDMLKKYDPKAKKVAIIYEQSEFAKAVCDAAKDYAQKHGFNVVMFEAYTPNTTDFSAFLNKMASLKPDALIGGGHFADGETLAKQVYEQKMPLKLISLIVAPAVPKFKEIGEAALYVTAPSQWEPEATYSPENAKKLKLAYYGPSVKWFADAYRNTYKQEPGYHAAGGFASALVLQKAIEETGTLDSNKIKQALDRMNIMTFYGQIKFAQGKYHGLQIGHEMVYLQWVKQNGQISKEVVWPLAAANTKLVFPYNIKFKK
ncbi:MAG: branched-chain amino acid ABC transporter substrate-binding protein [Desulfurella sp.]|uniref:amino acid ABC transporter substrate-binding protein n=1 Tax=Desulfurella sp. TaxID=1962857 RepID=UPI000CC71368|nr:amino acid ABC transporter substrate-binding protein [Desulfurella sp.]PMP92239.1 MAG: branched-chain amino acid ABC transporter substrate-binding protein [Desulfurella sp.]HEX13632.1 branched-chain amino acid ABC transporter substrate-binding protein [Desulfurella acetivorans]